MDNRFILGILGSLFLVAGAFLHDRPTKHPARSLKNELFAVGNLCMMIYALLGYLGGGTIFFFILEFFIAVSTVCMLLNVPDRIDTPLLAVTGIGLILWSILLFHGFGTVPFVVGLTLLGIGFSTEGGTVHREALLTLGSAMLVIFSFLERDWVFVFLNVFFSLFSLLNVYRLQKAKLLHSQKKREARRPLAVV